MTCNHDEKRAFRKVIFNFKDTNIVLIPYSEATDSHIEKKTIGYFITTGLRPIAKISTNVQLSMCQSFVIHKDN